MVGQHLKKFLPGAIYMGRSNGYDFTCSETVDRVFKLNKPDAVVHLAAVVGGIQDNISRPAEFFDQNVLMNTLVISGAMRHGVQRLIAIGSTCMYPDVCTSYPMKETDIHLGPPADTNFGYGYAKRAMAVQIDQYNRQYGSRYCYLIPSNLYGEYDKYQDSASHYVAALIKKIHCALHTGAEHITLFGSGKPLRQFMHAEDLAKVIAHCIQRDVYINANVTPDEVYSIDQIARIALKACNGQHLRIEYDLQKPDGQYRKDCCNAILKKAFPDLKFKSLEEGIAQTYEHYSRFGA